MKVNKLYFLLLLLIFSCSKEDEVPAELLLSNYEEPNIEFGITQTQFEEQLLIEPDFEELGYIELQNPQNGIYRILYNFLPPQTGYIPGDPIFYSFCNVIFYEYDQNFDNILSFLTNKYGEPEEIRILAGQNLYSYEWFEDGFQIYLSKSVDGLNPSDEVPNLLLTYTLF